MAIGTDANDGSKGGRIAAPATANRHARLAKGMVFELPPAAVRRLGHSTQVFRSMVKAAFSDLKVDFWVHGGKLGVSRPTLCVFHDSIQSGSPILDALHELRNETVPAQRTLTFVTCVREGALTKLRLMAVLKHENLRVMNIRCDGAAATIETTDDGLMLLINACTKWLAGVEDFGVSPRHSTLKPKTLGRLDLQSGELWFWGPRYTGP